jgi:hypothetical protein
VLRYWLRDQSHHCRLFHYHCWAWNLSWWVQHKMDRISAWLMRGPRDNKPIKPFSGDIPF